MITKLSALSTCVLVSSVGPLLALWGEIREGSHYPVSSYDFAVEYRVMRARMGQSVAPSPHRAYTSIFRSWTAFCGGGLIEEAEYFDAAVF